eukprot:gene31597-39033_t
MSGRGVHRFDNGSEYRGKFVDGAYCDTEGRLNLADQSTYVGGFVDGKYHGKGTLTRAGDTYSGQWANGKTQGKCVVKHSHGTSYIGELVDFKRRGRGALYNARNQLVYDGDLFDGWKHGTGSWTYPNKDVYSGTLDHDKRHGFGVMKYANGSKYEGEWSHDLREGQGVMTATVENSEINETDFPKIIGPAFFSAKAESHKGLCHGGSFCALMDDAIGWMGFCVSGEVRPWTGYTVQVNTSLKKSVRVGSTLKLEAWVNRKEGARKYWITSRLSDPLTGDVHCEAEGLCLLSPEEVKA